MADNVENATFEILKNIQASIAQLRAETNESFDQLRVEMSQRFEDFAAEARKDRRNINGLMALLQAASGDFDERIRELDDRVSIVEDSRFDAAALAFESPGYSCHRGLDLSRG